MRRLSAAMSALLLLAMTGVPAVADDVEPPDYRGEPLSVFSEYDPVVEIEQGQVLSDPFASFPITLDPSSTAFDWVDDDDPTTTLSELVAEMTAAPGTGPTGGNVYRIMQPNVIDQLPLKKLRVQMTWVSPSPTGPGDVPSIDITGLDPSGAVSVAPVGSFNAAIFSGGVWGGIEVFDYELRPNPDQETITITTAREDIFIDQVVVDSQSLVPEPSSLGLLLLAAGLMITRRGRR